MKPVKTRQALRNQIYKLIAPLTKGFFDDESWENVSRIWMALDAAGAQVTITKTQYQELNSKTWSFDLEAFGIKLSGQLVACFCGTIEKPTSRYDICFII
jgi:hypothetical protein